MTLYTLENEVFSRVFEVSKSGIRSVSMTDKRSGREYLTIPAREFQFSIDDRMYSSWQSSAIRIVDGNAETNGCAPEFIRVEGSEGELTLFFKVNSIELAVNYWIFPGVCGYRKSLTMKNLSGSKVKIDKVVFDDTCAAPGKLADCDFYTGFNDTPQMPCFTCEGCEDMVRCHNESVDSGWFMGSSAPGVLRYMMIYPVWRNALNALNMSSAPFAVWLEKDEKFTTPESIFSLYSAKFGDESAADDFRALIRKNLPPLPLPEGLMYCTWIPFLKNIDRELVLELIQHAADLNYRSFVLDDGWFSPDDHAVDREKFPNGLEEISRAVREKNMVFGLWLNVGTDYGRKNLPEEFFARQYDGRNSRLGFDYSHSGNVLCLGSSYREKLLDELCTLTEKYQVGYFKLDFSSVNSPYGLLPFGCHAHDHAHHRSWEDSFAAIYEGMEFIRKEMREKFPQVILDFSFEAFGTEKPNIAALELSPLHHVTNIAADDPEIQSISKARQSFYPWLKRLPAERILNGLLAIQGDSCAEAMLSAFAGAPLTAGDLRKLTGENRARLRKFAAAFNRAVADGHLTTFRTFEVGKEVDGFCRLNQKGSGFAAFFNRNELEFAIEVPAGVRLTDVETGSTIPVVSGNDCAMFFWENTL